MIPPLNLTKKNSLKREPTKQQDAKRSKHSEKSGREKVVHAIKSKVSAFTLSSPRSGAHLNTRPDAAPDTPRTGWTQAGKDRADSRSRIPQTSHRETRSDVLRRLKEDGQIVLSASDTGDELCLIAHDIDEVDLWRACMALSLQEPKDFTEACTLLDAALALMGNEEHRHQLMAFMAPAVLCHCPDGLPTDRWPALRHAIQPHLQEALRTRLVQSLSRKEIAIRQLAQQNKPKLSQGQALLQQLHELLREALALGETEWARTIVATASRLQHLYESDHFKRAARAEAELKPRDLSRIRAEADALCGTWQKALLARWRVPAFEILFESDQGEDKESLPPPGGADSRPASLVQVHGAGERVQFSFHGPVDAASATAVAQVCEYWCERGWFDEAEALLKAALNTGSDASLLRELSAELSQRLLTLVGYEDAESDEAPSEADPKEIEAAFELARETEGLDALAQGKTIRRTPAVTEIQGRESVWSIKTDDEERVFREAADAEQRQRKQTTTLRCIGLLALIHPGMPLPLNRIQWMVDQLTAALSDVRYDFDGMRRVHAAAEQLRQALVAPGRSVPLALQAQVSELAQASRDQLGPLRHFDERWAVERDAQGTVQSIGYKPPRIRGEAKQLLERAKAHDAKTEKLNLEQDDALRATLTRLNFVDPAQLSETEKRLLASQLDWNNERISLWRDMEEHGADKSYESVMLSADIKRFLEDPKGPSWEVMEKAIMAACTRLAWAPKPAHWLGWSILALRQDIRAPFIKRMNQTARTLSRDLGVSEAVGIAKATDQFVATLMDLMDQHTPWTIIQEALRQFELGVQWPISDSDLARLCLAQASRGDPAPLIKLLDRPHAVQLPPSELHKLLSLLEHPPATAAWVKLRKLAKPLFKEAPQALKQAYRQTKPGAQPTQQEQPPGPPVRRPALASHQLPLHKWLSAEDFQVEPHPFEQYKQKGV